MEIDKVTEKTLDMIHKLLKDKNQFDDWLREWGVKNSKALP